MQNPAGIDSGFVATSARQYFPQEIYSSQLGTTIHWTNILEMIISLFIWKNFCLPGYLTLLLAVVLLSSRLHPQHETSCDSETQMKKYVKSKFKKQLGSSPTTLLNSECKEETLECLKSRNKFKKNEADTERTNTWFTRTLHCVFIWTIVYLHSICSRKSHLERE